MKFPIHKKSYKNWKKFKFFMAEKNEIFIGARCIKKFFLDELATSCIAQGY